MKVRLVLVVVVYILGVYGDSLFGRGDSNIIQHY